MKSIVISALLFFVSMPLLALDCEFVPKKSLCGVSLSSPKNDLFKVTGKPSASINMSENRVGYVFSNKTSNNVFMAIYSGSLLVEIRTWESNPNIDFWSLLSPSENINLIIRGVKLLGMTRSQIGKLDSIFTSDDADQFGENRKYHGSSIDIFYAPFYGVHSAPGGGLGSWEEYNSQSITIRHLYGEP